VLASPSRLVLGCFDQIGAALFGSGQVDHAAIGGLRERLAQVPDPRSPRGLRHSLLSILLITICGVAAEKNFYTTIEAWARDAPAHVLAAFGVRFDPFTARHLCPDESTLRDVLARVDPDALTAAGRDYLSDLSEGRARTRTEVPDEREARRARTAPADPEATGKPVGYAADGKRLAGAKRRDGTHVNLLSLVRHGDGVTLAQREINAKSNEIPEATRLLADVDVSGGVVTLDALHTQRKTAQAIIADHHAAYVLAIKGNQPNLARAVAARFTATNASFQDAGRYFAHTDRGHGRIEHREIRTADATGIDFPHAAQLFQITRRSKKLDAQAWDHKEVVFGITALTTAQAGPADLARYTRGHWSVENKSHYIRDVTFREDANQTRTRHAPANLATCRNIVIGALRQAGNLNIAHARSRQANNYDRALTLFDL
jgi:predicted transposase YbfD/YdcC